MSNKLRERLIRVSSYVGIAYVFSIPVRILVTDYRHSVIGSLLALVLAIPLHDKLFPEDNDDTAV